MERGRVKDTGTPMLGLPPVPSGDCAFFWYEVYSGLARITLHVIPSWVLLIIPMKMAMQASSSGPDKVEIARLQAVIANMTSSPGQYASNVMPSAPDPYSDVSLLSSARPRPFYCWRSPTGFLVVSGVGVTGTVRGRPAGCCCCLVRLLLLLGRDRGWRLRVAGRWRAFAAPENGEEGSPRVR